MRTLPGFLSPGSSNHKAICRKKAARANNVTVFSSAGQGGAVDSNVAQRKLIRASAKTGRKVSARNGTDQNKLRCSRRHEYPLEKRCAKISSTNLKPMYKKVRREKRVGWEFPPTLTHAQKADQQSERRTCQKRLRAYGLDPGQKPEDGNTQEVSREVDGPAQLDTSEKTSLIVFSSQTTFTPRRAF